MSVTDRIQNYGTINRSLGFTGSDAISKESHHLQEAGFIIHLHSHESVFLIEPDQPFILTAINPDKAPADEVMPFLKEVHRIIDELASRNLTTIAIVLSQLTDQEAGNIVIHEDAVEPLPHRIGDILLYSEARKRQGDIRKDRDSFLRGGFLFENQIGPALVSLLKRD